MAQLIYVLDLRANDMTVEIRVNDILVVKTEAEGQAVEQAVINAYVVGGANKLEARFRPLQTGEPKLAYRVVRTHRAPDAPEEVLLQRDTPATLPLMSPGQPEQRVPDDFRVADGFGPWAWNAPGVQPQLGGRPAGALDLVRRLHAAFEGRDVDTILDSFSLRFEELGRALQLPPAQLRESAREHYDYLFSSTGWGLAPFVEQDVVLTPVAQGRAVMPYTRNGDPVIRSRSGAPFRLDLLLVDVPGQGWRVVR